MDVFYYYDSRGREFVTPNRDVAISRATHYGTIDKIFVATHDELS